MREPRSLILVGGGIIGLCSAYYAARRGLDVTILDRSPVRDQGCSFGNAGMIVPSHFVPLAAPGMVGMGLRMMLNPESPFYIRPRWDADLLTWLLRFWRAANPEHVRRASPLLRDLNLASRAAYAEIAAAGGADFGLRQEGLLMLCRTPHGFEEEAQGAERARSLGLAAEVLDARSVAVREPGVTLNVAGAVYYPQDCHLSPGRFMAYLHQELDRLGVRHRLGQEVTAFRREGSRLRAAVTADGEFEADSLVLAGGAWSGAVARGLGLRLPMEAGKGYSLTVDQPRELPRHCAILTEARMAVTPMGQSLRFGGTMELAGLDESLNPARVRGLLRSIPQYYPAFQASDFSRIPAWRGLRPCSPDGLPYLGRTAAAENLILATGHAMMGLSLGPVTGQIVADLVTQQTPAFDLAMMNPDRFA